MVNETPTDTVDFRYHQEHENQVVPPKPVHEEFPKIKRNGWLPNEFHIASERDVKVSDVSQYGWYLYAPEAVMFTASERDGEITPQTGAGYVEEESTVNVLDNGYAGYLNTLLHVRVPDEHTLLITPPLHAEPSPVRSTTMSSEETWPAIEIPVVVTERTTIHPTEPVATALLAPTELLETDSFAATAFTDDAKKRFRELEGLQEVFNNPYPDAIHSEKPTPGEKSGDD